MEKLLEALPRFIPALVALAVTVLVLLVVRRTLDRRKGKPKEESHFSAQLTMLALTALGLVAILLTLPVEESTRKELLGILGLALTAVIALSSTTFVANAMGGLMLRAARSFKPGDFIRAGEQFGRVTERGLFHTEIQTEDRDLTTLPNLYLVSHPFTVVRSSGTIVSASLSLGYDVAHSVVEPLLLEAAEDAGLLEPFVQVLDLNDYSVNYRVAGFLEEVKQILTARSHLRVRILETLHGAGVEIVSPQVVTQRRVPESTRIVPAESLAGRKGAESPDDRIPEEIIFDKAELAERQEAIRKETEKLDAELAELHAALKHTGEDERGEVERRLAAGKSRLQALATELDRLENLPKD